MGVMLSQELFFSIGDFIRVANITRLYGINNRESFLVELSDSFVDRLPSKMSIRR